MPPRAERPMSFRDSLPAEARQRLWLPWGGVLLMLPDHPTNVWTGCRGAVFQVFRNPYTRQEAYNVASFTPAQEPPHG